MKIYKLKVPLIGISADLEHPINLYPGRKVVYDKLFKDYVIWGSVNNEDIEIRHGDFILDYPRFQVQDIEELVKRNIIEEDILINNK